MRQSLSALTQSNTLARFWPFKQSARLILGFMALCLFVQTAVPATSNSNCSYNKKDPNIIDLQKVAEKLKHKNYKGTAWKGYPGAVVPIYETVKLP